MRRGLRAYEKGVVFVGALVALLMLGMVLSSLPLLAGALLATLVFDGIAGPWMNRERDRYRLARKVGMAARRKPQDRLPAPVACPAPRRMLPLERGITYATLAGLAGAGFACLVLWS